MHILLVEDEVRLAENVAADLRETPGYAVDCASDGQIGASLASNRCYDLIILDLMPAQRPASVEPVIALRAD
ncbi:hypothetical protein [Tunturiibacter gelidoferens]|jgi:DNA-binding response OmpR family regulator|uniref:DNA-binding response OmpR family regulator n=1 Tax=Tunturiibacter gelidiferens TaxID=3069689 RepID=A0A9X0U5U4_9BACT|nr:hypothetical protein [Edaphobacter lichenicola]MBB5330894.1 DNA-binding response OmpR family regulator [Edaphobacter lichenicola]